VASCSIGSSYDLPVRLSTTEIVSARMTSLLGPMCPSCHDRRIDGPPEYNRDIRRAQDLLGHTAQQQPRDASSTMGRHGDAEKNGDRRASRPCSPPLPLAARARDHQAPPSSVIVTEFGVAGFVTRPRSSDTPG